MEIWSKLATATSDATIKAKKPAVKVKGTGKPKPSKASASHPPYSVMVKAAVVVLKDRKGSGHTPMLK
ncbi:unnamed protein product [Toxocara canis]|uniref:H15 domain-containing protein n=1 Tax=Toxocara canis TaxID=6265 RepID=A0A183UA62_TOXCA|nr:unnamed protein product [Toxocara canis]